MKPSDSMKSQEENTRGTRIAENVSEDVVKPSKASSNIGQVSGRKRTHAPDETGPEQKQPLLQTEDVVYDSDMSLDSESMVENPARDDTESDQEVVDNQEKVKSEFNQTTSDKVHLSSKSNDQETHRNESDLLELNSELDSLAPCVNSTVHVCDGEQVLERESTKKLTRYERKQLYRMGCRPFVNTPFGDVFMQACSHIIDPNWLRFRVASYNILSQDLLSANMYLYRSTKPNVLEWDYRKSRLMRDIFYADADVVCLQEVHHEHYETFFKKQLEMKGYQGHYMKRTGSQNDGCASFFRKSVFKLDKAVPVAYHRENVDVLDRHNIALLLLLSIKRQPDVKLCVSNTHLLFNPRRNDVRFAQVMVLLAEIDRLSYYDTDVNGKPLHHPIVMCGDFNSEPSCDLYQLIKQGSVKYDCPVAGSWDKKLLDHSVGITDQCQYVADLYWRFAKYARKWRDICHQTIPCMQNVRGTNITSGDHPATVSQKNATNSPDVTSSSEKLELVIIPDALPVFLSDSSLLSSCTNLPFTCDVSEQSLVDNPVANLSRVMRPHSFQFTFGSGFIYHHLSLDSVYTHGRRHNTEVTTNHLRANCTVDYIFYTRQQSSNEDNPLNPMPHELRLLNRMKLLTEEEVLRLGGLPNSAMSSDHFLICGTFVLGLQRNHC